MVDIRKVTSFWTSSYLDDWRTTTPNQPFPDITGLISTAYVRVDTLGSSQKNDPFNIIETRTVSSNITTTGFVIPFSRRYRLRMNVISQNVETSTAASVPSYTTFSAVTVITAADIYRDGSVINVYDNTVNSYGNIICYLPAGSYSAGATLGFGAYQPAATGDYEIDLFAGDFLVLRIIYLLGVIPQPPPGFTLRLYDSPLFTAQLTEITDL